MVVFAALSWCATWPAWAGAAGCSPSEPSFMPSLKPLTAPPKSWPMFFSFLVPKTSTTISKTTTQCQIEKRTHERYLLANVAHCSRGLGDPNVPGLLPIKENRLFLPRARPADHVHVQMVHLLPALFPGIDLHPESPRQDRGCSPLAPPAGGPASGCGPAKRHRLAGCAPAKRCGAWG